MYPTGVYVLRIFDIADYLTDTYRSKMFGYSLGLTLKFAREGIITAIWLH